MRKEIMEYDLDWTLWSMMNNASKISGSTEKELAYLFKYMPTFSELPALFSTFGDVGPTFFEMSGSYLNNIITAKERGKKTAITTFCLSPAILYAMDVVPITLELLTVMGTVMWERGTADYLDYCIEAGFTETSCSSQRGSLGAYLAGLGVDIDFIINDSPGVCDTNANAFAFAAAYLDKPFFQLNMPSDLTSERATEYHRQDFMAMINFIEDQTGKKLDQDKLREILDEVKIQEEIISEIEELQMLTPNPAPVEFSFLIYATRFLFSGSKEGTKGLHVMLKQIKENAARGASGLSGGVEKSRALFCYIDHYTTDMRFWKMLNKNGVTHLGNILGRAWYETAPLPKHKGDKDESFSIDTSNLETMVDTIGAINARMPMIKSIRGPYDSPHMWLDDNLALAKMYNVDFIVYSGTPGCRNTWGMVKLFARDTEKHGYPTHLMYSDAFDDRVESWETTEARFEEFLQVRRLV